MPVYSMTGYAGATGPGGLTVECRSVNGRFLDLTLKLPEDLRGLEPALREAVSQHLRRGKVELRISGPAAAADTLQPPAFDTLQRLAQLENQVHTLLPQARGLSVAEVLNLARQAPSAAPGDAAALQTAMDSLLGLKAARQREGERLVHGLLERVDRIAELARQAAPLVPQVVQRQQARFLERWREALQAADASAAVSPQAVQERALTEAAAYALRLDVAEELTRLQAHLDEIRRLLTEGGEIGKRLDFLIQELHREANTLGSKSAALELTNLSVDMKVAIEQMREQVQNIE